jgi:hypothetical protein
MRLGYNMYRAKPPTARHAVSQGPTNQHERLRMSKQSERARELTQAHENNCDLARSYNDQDDVAATKDRTRTLALAWLIKDAKGLSLRPAK